METNSTLTATEMPGTKHLHTNLSGRLRNTNLPFSSALQPLFETVVNSIHSIEQVGLGADQGKIRIRVLRDEQGRVELDDKKRRGPDRLLDIIGFEVWDNGAGFTDDNMQSFCTLDSDYKVHLGCRGVGRLLWLKAFTVAKVESIFTESGQTLRRSFTFDAKSGINNQGLVPHNITELSGTTIRLESFDPRYRAHAPKSAKAIASSLLEHCLWYFVRPGGAPNIEVIDDPDIFLLQDIYNQQMHSSASTEKLKVEDYLFDLVHVKLRSNTLNSHVIAYCADNRLVLEEKISGKLAGLYGKLTDNVGTFVYACYVSSQYLDEHARPERTDFDIIGSSDGLFASTELGMEQIRNAVLSAAKRHLGPYLTGNLVKAKERVAKFVATKGARYGPIMARIPDDELIIDPEVTDRELELLLHKHLSKIESELLSEGHEILAGVLSDGSTQYNERLRSYLSKAQDIKQSDLAAYVSHRRVIIDLFEKAIQRDEEGRYSREDILHQLIIPMGEDSDSITNQSVNLWLVDERLAFHHYLASDRPICSMPITGSKDRKEPDVCILNVFDQPILVSEGTTLPPASLQIIEIKRPMRDNTKAGEEHDPIEQAIGYVRRIRAGGVTTRFGRPLQASDHIPAYCYILADLTPSFIERCNDHHDLKRTADGLGFFGYKENLRAYIEVFSFERLLNAAKQRNRAFFDKLGLPCS